MKFATKIVISTTIILMIFFTGLGTVLISRGFERSIQERESYNSRQHFSELYTLKSNLVAEISRGQEVTNDMVIRYVNQYVSYSDTSNVAVVSKNEAVIYNGVSQVFEDAKIINFSKAYNNKSVILKVGNNSYMIMSSKSEIGDFSYHLIHVFDITTVFDNRLSQITFFFTTLLIMMLLSVAIVWGMASFVTKPIRKLNDASKEIAEGNYSVRTHVDTQDEIGELSQSFDWMVESLERDIKRREAFITDFSHELKTPMTAIVGYADILRSQQCNEDEKFEYANYIYKSGKRLENLSASMMELLGLSEKELVLGSVSIKSVKQAVFFIFKYLEDIEISYDLEEVMVLGERNLLITLFRNLIDNARKAEPKDKKIWVIGKQVEQRYRVSIRDTGRGMTEEEISHVTEAFYMADKSRSRSQGGAGIGLSICEKICDLHHAKLNFESKLGEGTVVSFDLEVYHE